MKVFYDMMSRNFGPSDALANATIDREVITESKRYMANVES